MTANENCSLYLHSFGIAASFVIAMIGIAPHNPGLLQQWDF